MRRSSPGGDVSFFQFLGALKGTLTGVGVISGAINLLALTSSIFMMLVYDRVIPSRSMPTLVGLVAFAAVMYGFHAALDIIRSRALSRVGLVFDQRFGDRLHDSIIASKPESAERAMQALRDFDQCRNFMSGGGAAAFFDLPWLPFYLSLCFFLHPLIGFVTIAGGGVLIALTLLAELCTKRPLAAATRFGTSRMSTIASTHRDREVIRAMGLSGPLASRWRDLNRDYLCAGVQVADTGSAIGVASRMARVALQSVLLAIGAYLVTQEKATGGVMMASSIIMGRALAPIEAVIAHWKGFVAAREGWRRLRARLSDLPPRSQGIAPPAPRAEAAAEGLTVAAPGSERILIRNVSFRVAAGGGVGVIGASGSGKSTLARALIGGEGVVGGRVRLDGAALDQWPGEELGRHIGYLPQSVDLLEGTVRENIARFDPHARAEDVHAAAKASGAHEMILRLPQGYETHVGENGAGLSAGQRQRVGLARALYGDPFLVVLDEPNANLDAEGEAALVTATLGVRARGGVVVIIAHRPSALAGVDHVLVMNAGHVQSFGPKEEVLNRTLRPQPVAAVTPLKAVAAD